MNFLHKLLLAVLTVSFVVSVTATPVLIHACRVCITDACCTKQTKSCCDGETSSDPCCARTEAADTKQKPTSSKPADFNKKPTNSKAATAKEPCCDEMVSVTTFQCDMMQPVPASETVVSPAIQVVLLPNLAVQDDGRLLTVNVETVNTGPEPSLAGLCVFQI